MLCLTGRPATLRLTRDLARALKRGHPWVFADALGPMPAASAGAPANLVDRGGKLVARGFCEPQSPLAFRAVSVDPREPVDDALVTRRIDEAIALRQRIIDPTTTTGYRLLNGEGDGLPGLVCDVYGDSAALRLDGPGAWAFWLGGVGVGALIAERLSLARVWARERGRRGEGGVAVVGEAPARPVPFLEHGARFTADLVHGQKTGFFLDQRENRRRIGALAAGCRVLNVFAYTGGFSVAAGLGGATMVTSVDLAAPAVAAAADHWRLNGLPPERHEGVCADAFEMLAAAASEGRRWDLVVVDPPSFAPRRAAAAAAVAAYTRLTAAAAAVVEPGGILASASCSSHVDLPGFVGAVEDGIGAARRRARVLEIAGQPADHPTPLPLPEMRYLKLVLMTVR